MKIVKTNIVVPDDDGSDEAMQYKNAPLAEEQQKKSKKSSPTATPKKAASALRSSSSDRTLRRSSLNKSTKVSFSDDNNASDSDDNKSKKSRKATFTKSASDSKLLKRSNKNKENKTNSTSSQSPSRKWNLGKRFSLFGGDGNKNSGNSSNSKHRKSGYGNLQEDDLDEAATPAEADPVLQLFESRNKQRVRFTLEGDDSSAYNPAVEKAMSPSDGREDANDEKLSPERHGGNGANLKQFMSRTLFGGSNKTASTKKLLEDEMKREVREISDSSLIWESASTPTDGPEVIHTHSSNEKQEELLLSFTEDSKARAAVTKLLGKAQRAELIHFRYEYAVKCYLKAVNILKKAKYPDDHPTVVKTVKLMNNSHHVLSSYNNSANIVKMGIKNEDAGELVKALKMYTIAYRIRRDNLSRSHPSLVVLLNMLGSIQIKRGELKEAMQIYELALSDTPVVFSGAVDEDEIEPPMENLLAKSVTYREMGTVHEMWGNVDEALQFFHKSLECVAEWRETVSGENSSSTREIATRRASLQSIATAGEESSGGMSRSKKNGSSNSANEYERFFPIAKSSAENDVKQSSDENCHADMDLSLTLHQIAQLYRAQGKYSKALDAFEVALRGMKTALGKHHPNVAAVLGNIGNLQKEMGNLDAAYKTYQEVLGIESYRLGLSHPDVAITLHNIATIDAARGNHESALQLYRKVIGLQKKLFGEDNLSVAVTAACMGDVYEKLGEIENSMDSFDEAVRIKSAVLGRHSLDVGRLLHKLAKLSFYRKEYLDAESYAARAILIYRLNKLDEDHQ
ncbi:MAG: hypothetical protein SGARI_000887, partial [Bacillariaceae sp.]